MQVFKRIKFIFCILILTACQSFTSREGVMQTPRQTDIFGSEGKFRTAMLLPLSGKAEAYGKGLQNAAMLAVEDSNNPALVVEFYDTQATPDGARRAASKALEGGAKYPDVATEDTAVLPKVEPKDEKVSDTTTIDATGIINLSMGSEVKPKLFDFDKMDDEDDTLEEEHERVLFRPVVQPKVTDTQTLARKINLPSLNPNEN